ncbi:unnamed protein product [Ilex paraguariensis]|uniref:Uncharacterized protein n=1 Tax=Ilex paraguariensis TaxID=185542 RepID=A0ABC8URH9_9AQUA
MEGEYDPQFNISGHGGMSVAEKSHEAKGRSPHLVDHLDDCVRGSQLAEQSVSALVNETDVIRRTDNTSAHDPSNTIVLQKEMQNAEDPTMQTRAERRSESSKINGTLKVVPGGQAALDNVGFSQFSPPSTTSFSPSRYQMEGEYDPQFNISGHGGMSVAEVNNPSSLLKQIQEHEDEISHLRKHIAEYSIKEAQVRNEKYILEKRIAYMRLAFDQQQQDLVDAASKALSYRQDIIEENIRLTYQLQAAHQERSTFVSSLMPLLAEYSLQPPVADAQSIVSNLKWSFELK